MNQSFVVSVGYAILCLLSCHDTDCVRRCLVICLARLIRFLVLTIRLHLGHLHIMDKFGIILKAAEAYKFSLVFFIS